MDLVSWAQIYLKHQDLLRKEIVSIEKQETKDEKKLLITKKKTQEVWLVADTLKSLQLNDKSTEEKNKITGIITYNTKENFSSLLTLWNALCETHYKLIFANPKTNERWVLVPLHHNKIADEESFQLGLESMFSSISEYA